MNPTIPSADRGPAEVAAADAALLGGAAREAYVERMFDRIARPYDDLNRIISWGRDLQWRKDAVRLADVRPGSRVVDLGCGTGDLTLEAAASTGPTGNVVGVDLSEGMLSVARSKIAAAGVAHAEVRKGNAQETGLPDACADAVTMGWVLRNVGDRPAAYREVRRLLRPGGRFVVLDCSRPASWFVRLGFSLYLRLVMPLAVRLRGGDPSAYRYLAASTARFLTAAELSAELRAAGFRDVAARGYLLGTIALHVAVR